MEIIFENIGWIILISIVCLIIAFKKITNRPDAITSKFYTSEIVKSSDHLKTTVLTALNNSGFPKVYHNEIDNKIYVQTSITMNSWGETIEIELEEEELQSKIHFKSICAFQFQIYDWGKNKRNFKRFWKEFKKL
ncbi:MAG: hypothetical protein IR153_10085 [Flavobacterium sp.]|nr:hypothetical protein [Flavobacterium sp.]